MVLVLSLLTVFMALALCNMLLWRVPAFRSREQLSAAEQAQQRLRQELSRHTVRFTPDGRILLELIDGTANRQTYCDAELRPIWEGKLWQDKDHQAPPFEVIQFARAPRRLDTAGITWGGTARDRGPFPLRLGRRPMFFLPDRTPSANPDRPLVIGWRYDPYGQVWERYDSDGRYLGALGAGGFVEAPGTGVPLGPVVVGVEASADTSAVWITPRRVYCLDFALPSTKIALDGEALHQLKLGTRTKTTHVRCQLITAEGEHHLWLANPREYRRLAIRTADGEPLIGDAGVDSGGRLYLQQVLKPGRGPALPGCPDVCCSATLYRVAPDGLAEEVCRHVWDLLVCEPRKAAPTAVSDWPLALLPPMLYAVPTQWFRERPNLAGSGPVAEVLREVGREALSELPFAGSAVTPLLVSLAWLLLGLALARRRGESWVAVAAWVPVVLALNLAGFLAWRLCAEGTVRTCAACGLRTAADTARCRHCGRDAAPEQELTIGSQGCPRITPAASQQSPNVAAGQACPVPPAVRTAGRRAPGGRGCVPAAAPAQRRPPADRPAVAGPERGQALGQGGGSAWELQPTLIQPDRRATGPAGMGLAAAIRRELWQFRPLLLFLAVAFAVSAALYRAALGSGRWAQRLLSYSALQDGCHGLLHVWGVTFCLACLALGLLNALSQFSFRSHGEWAFLLHRPDTRLRLFTGLLTGGLLATVVFPGVLWTVLWGLTRDVSGEFGAPLRHLLEGWVFALWGAVVYLGTALCCLDRLSGSLGRLLGPALAAVAVLYGLLGAPSVAWCLAVAAMITVLLLVQLYDRFAGREF
jgi:hypothetical protein